MVTFAFISLKCGKWAYLFCFEAHKNIPCKNISTMGNNQLYAIMLVHVHKNILDNYKWICWQKRAANNHSDIFLRIIYNIFKIKLKLRYFWYINIISYQMYIPWSCATIHLTWSSLMLYRNIISLWKISLNLITFFVQICGALRDLVPFVQF